MSNPCHEALRPGKERNVGKQGCQTLCKSNWNPNSRQSAVQHRHGLSTLFYIQRITVTMLETNKTIRTQHFSSKKKMNIAMAEPRAKRNRTSPDLKIRLEDGNVQVHALVLYLASPWFAGMLDLLQAQPESQEKSIQLTGKTTEEFKLFYNSLQLATMQDLTPSTANVLLKFADEYEWKN